MSARSFICAGQARQRLVFARGQLCGSGYAHARHAVTFPLNHPNGLSPVLPTVPHAPPESPAETQQMLKPGTE